MPAWSGSPSIALSPGGFGPLDAVLVALFAVTLPWYVIGFWNATIGLLIMRFARDPVAAVMPAAGRVRGDEPITASTAILLCIRNEPPERVARLLEPMMEGSRRAACGERFHVYVLSDTSDAEIAAAESTRFAALAAAWRGQVTLTYRRRASNTGFKAGNIRDFCERWGSDHDFAVDARRRQRHDGRPSCSGSCASCRPIRGSASCRAWSSACRRPAPSRVSSSSACGSACAPTPSAARGGRAIADPIGATTRSLRIAPFMAHCELPVLTGGALVEGHVLSHDQIEAVLMRRAGYEVRVLPEEGASFEQNPPTLVEFIRRDLRWCQGNMQYWHFLRMPGLRPVSRYQLVFAILMFLGSPAWIGLLLIGTIAVALARTAADFMRWDAGLALLLLRAGDVVCTQHRDRDRRADPPASCATLFGGGLRFQRELHHYDHLRRAGRSDHVGEPHGVSRASSVRPHHRLGRAGARRSRGAVVAGASDTSGRRPCSGSCRCPCSRSAHRRLFPMRCFIAGGPLLSIPLAVATAAPALGRALIAIGLDRLPEETAPPPELRALALPAIELSQRSR